MVFYLYFAIAKIDIILLLYYFGFFIFYNNLQKIFKNINFANKTLIKYQSTNYKFIKIWNNFKYQENSYKEKVKDVVKFWLVIITL